MTNKDFLFEITVNPDYVELDHKRYFPRPKVEKIGSKIIHKSCDSCDFMRIKLNDPNKNVCKLVPCLAKERPDHKSVYYVYHETFHNS